MVNALPYRAIIQDIFDLLLEIFGADGLYGSRGSAGITACDAQPEKQRGAGVFALYEEG